MVWLTAAGPVRLKSAKPLWPKAHAALSAQFAPELAQRLALASEALEAEPARRSRTGSQS